MKTIAELLSAYHANTLTLPIVLETLAARGALPEDAYQAELDWLGRMREDGEIDPGVAGEVAAYLQALQGEPPGDATVVKPAWSPAMVDDDATVVKPALQSSTTGGHTASTQGTGSGGSWRRIAHVESGDRATVGMLLKGRFLLEREIGRGGMGVVYLARDERKVEARDRDPYVAVKVLNDEFRRHPDSLIALQRESRRAQSLAHDNIVRVYDFDKDRTIVFMTMEHIDGADLRTLIRERARLGLPLAEAWPLIRGMGRALQRAHAAGIVHSDFKPGNVMVTAAGVAKVFDFGIARAGKHLGEASGEQTVFDAGTLGALTPAYASLEMLQGREPAPGDDIYGLGCVVFELLTGRHPFDKVSAEVAMNEGRRPPPVPGLSRRQYKALCDSVAFTADKRLKSAADLLEGLREIGLRERLGPFMLYGAAAVVAIAAGGWGLTRYMHHRHVAHVVVRFAAADPHHFADEDQAVQALNALDEDERKRLVVDQSEVIQHFLAGRIDAYWSPAAGRIDYARVQHVFQLRDQLKLFSPALDVKRDEVDRQRNELLNSLDTRLAQRIDADAIFADQPDNVIAILAQIRAIDPHSSLLKNAELALKYDLAIGQSLDAGHMAEARQRIGQAIGLFPDSTRLKARAAQLAALEAAAVKPAATPGTGSVPDARHALATLAASPAPGADWQQAVVDAMAVLRNDDTAETKTTIESLANGIASMVARDNDASDAPQNFELVTFGLQYAPQSANLLAQRDRLEPLRQQAQAQLDQDTANAEVAARIDSLRQAAAANDTAKAQDSLARIRALQPTNPFLATEGPQLVASAYLGLAEDTCQHGKWQDAANVLTQGIAALGDRVDMRNAKDRYELVATMMGARGQPLADDDYQRLRGQLADVEKADPDGVKQLESNMSKRGKLPQGTLDGLLSALKTNTAAQPAATAAARAPTAPIPGMTPARGADPCGRKGMAGKAQVCFDTFSAGSHGPALVVVPGLNGGKPYAMSRMEISVSDLNRYCVATHQCDPVAVPDADTGNAPARNITLSQARGYAIWLSRLSGYVYRLPTDEEWVHAADADSGWKRAADSDCLAPSEHSLFGAAGPDATRGHEANPWGLLNMSGSVWEWVTSGTTITVRGGGFDSSASECSVDSHRADNGSRHRDVGFRLLRELK